MGYQIFSDSIVQMTIPSQEIRRYQFIINGALSMYFVNVFVNTVWILDYYIDNNNATNTNLYINFLLPTNVVYGFSQMSQGEGNIDFLVFQDCRQSKGYKITR